MKPFLVYSRLRGWWFWRMGNFTSQPFYCQRVAVATLKVGYIDWQE